MHMMSISCSMADATSSDDWQSLLKVLMLKVDICIFFELFKNLGFCCSFVFMMQGVTLYPDTRSFIIRDTSDAA